MIAILGLFLLYLVFRRICRLVDIIRTDDFKNSCAINAFGFILLVIFCIQMSGPGRYNSNLVYFFRMILTIVAIILLLKRKSIINYFDANDFDSISDNILNLVKSKPRIRIGGFAVFLSWIVMSVFYLIVSIVLLNTRISAVQGTLIFIILSFSLVLAYVENYRLFWFVLANCIFIGLSLYHIDSGLRGEFNHTDGMTDGLTAAAIADSGNGLDAVGGIGDISEMDSIGADSIISPTPNVEITHIADVPDANIGMNADFIPDGVQFDSDSVGHLDTNLNQFVDGSMAYSGSDMMDGNFMDIFSGTNMVDIPQMQQYPYMIFNDPSISNNFQICDSSGMPQMTISDGNIVNAESAIIGHVNTNAAGVTTFTDINNVPIYSVDSHGQMFSDGCYIGHTTHSGNVVEIRDINEKLLAIKDTLTGTCRTPDGKILSQIKQM